MREFSEKCAGVYVHHIEMVSLRGNIVKGSSEYIFFVSHTIILLCSSLKLKNFTPCENRSFVQYGQRLIRQYKLKNVAENEVSKQGSFVRRVRVEILIVI